MMEREKRQIKAPQGYVIPQICYPRIRKKKPKPKPPQEIHYQVIPAPMKFVYTANFFALYGVRQKFPFSPSFSFYSISLYQAY